MEPVIRHNMQAQKATSQVSQGKLGKLEFYFLLLIIVLAAFFHWVLQTHAGAFWRDECSSILLARSKSWSDVFAGLFTDSFPALWVVLLRLWDMAGSSSGELWLRSIGFWLSLGAIASLWYAAKASRLSSPVLAASLLVFNPAVFYWGDSLRAYGLAMVLVILLFGCVWRFCEEGGKKNLILAAVTAILSAQSNYQSSYLILAICLAGALVCAVGQQRGRAVMVIGIGFIAALSMIPYRSVIVQFSPAARVLSIPDVSIALLWQRFTEGFDSTLSFSIWAELYLLCLALPVYYWISGAHKSNPEAFRRSLYAATSSLIAPIGFYLFARKAGLPTQCWYSIPILGLLAMAIEMSVTGLMDRLRLRQARLLVAVLVVLAGIAPVWKQAHMRRTNIDLVAAQVAAAAAVKDLVLINPFWEVASFQCYYKGKAPWSTLPVVPDEQRGMSYFAVFPLMTSPEPLKATFERIEKTLQNGGKVWIVGGLRQSPEATQPPEWIPAPHPVHGWQNAAFMEIWSTQTGWFVGHHAVDRKVMRVTSDQAISRFEDIESIVVFSGWNDQTAARNPR